MPTRTLPLVIALLLLAGASPAAGASAPDGFAVELVVPGPFPGPSIGFAFLPDERIVVVTKNGGVLLSPAGGGAGTLLHTIPGVTTVGEQGLAGVAVDPGWPGRPYLYFYFTHSSGTARVLMMTASGDLSDPESTNVSLASPYLLLDDIPDANDAHNGGTLRFGPDGMLYLSLGDDEDDCAAQDTTSLPGSVLRLDVSAMPGAGTGPPPKASITPSDNPLPGPDENERLLYAWGLRNPFRFTIDPATGDVFAGDVGLASWEEIDRLVATGYTGDNCGWPQREGPAANDPGDSCGVGNPFVDPIFAYPHSLFAPHSVVCGPRYRFVPGRDTALPASYDGQLFYCDFFEGILRRLAENGGVWSNPPPVPGQPGPDDWATGLGSVADLQQGPDGAIWCMNIALIFRSPAAPDEGLYRVARTIPTGVTPAAPAPALAVHPNPVPPGRVAVLRLGSGTDRARFVRVFDVAGRTVARLALPPGLDEIVWRPADLPAGVYFLSSGTGDPTPAKVTLLR